MKRARDIMKRLVTKRPESTRHRLKLAELHNTMYNNFVGNQRRQEEALQSSQDAINLYKELLARSPHSPRFKTRLAMMHDNRGMIFGRQGKYAEAVPEGRRARAILLEVVRANPENDRYRGYLVATCGRLGLSAYNHGRQ